MTAADPLRPQVARRARVLRYPTATWWCVIRYWPQTGQQWPMAAHTFTAAIRMADRWTRGLHATGDDR